MLGDVFEDIFDMVGQVGDAVDAYQVARALQRVRDTLRGLDVLLDT